MSYAGIGQFEPPPKDEPIMTLIPSGAVQSSVQSGSVPPSVQRAMPWLVPTTSSSQTAVPVSDWRRQIQRALEAATLAILSLPGEIIAFFTGIAPTIRQDVEDFGRSLTDPSRTDAEVAEKLAKVRDRYRTLRPSLPAPAVGVLDPLIDNVVGLVPANVTVPSVTTPSFTIPWLWVAGSFVAGMAACSFLGDTKKVQANRRRRARRNRRRR